MGLIQIVKDKLFGDIKKFAVNKVKEGLEVFKTMAVAMDLDNDKVPDIKEVERDCNEIFGNLQAAGKSIVACGKPLANLSKLAGLYYVKFGPKKPAQVVASLEIKPDIA